jgi:hypothetical protein
VRLAALLVCAATCPLVSAGQETPGGFEPEAGPALTGAAEDPPASEADPIVEEYDTRGSASIAARMQGVNFSLQTPDDSASDVEVGYKTEDGTAFGGQITWGNSSLSYFEDGVLYYTRWGRRYSFDAYYIDRSAFEYDRDLPQPDVVTDYSPAGLHARGYGASLLYVFDPEEFSFPAAFGHVARHVSSCGSFVAIASLSGCEVGASEPLIPPALQVYYDEIGAVQRARLFIVSGAGGYAGALVLSGGRYLVGSAIVGFGLNGSEYDVGGSTRSTDGGTLKAVFHLGFGQDWGPFFFRFTGKVDWEVNDVDDYNMAFQHLNGTFTFGARF